MNSFDVFSFVWILHEATQAEMGFLNLKMLGQGHTRPVGAPFDKANSFFSKAEILFQYHNLEDCLKAVTAAKFQWSKPLVDVSAACVIFNRVQADIVTSLQLKKFLRIATDRSDLVDEDRLFGDQVYDAFYSANRDIKEAGNCLAAECNTAAVFHLMRASEVALRAIATDRQVSFANKPLDQQEWGTILGALEGILKKMRLDDAKKWPSPKLKEAQINFYNDTIQELRSFNEAWRRHLSHADTEAFYDRDQAFSIMNHVKKFMQKLSTKVGEQKCTPEYWDSL